MIRLCAIVSSILTDCSPLVPQIREINREPADAVEGPLGTAFAMDGHSPRGQN